MSMDRLDTTPWNGDLGDFGEAHAGIFSGAMPIITTFI
jgi:hypothetical protein